MQGSSAGAVQEHKHEVCPSAALPPQATRGHPKELSQGESEVKGLCSNNREVRQSSGAEECCPGKCPALLWRCCADTWTTLETSYSLWHFSGIRASRAGTVVAAQTRGWLVAAGTKVVDPGKPRWYTLHFRTAKFFLKRSLRGMFSYSWIKVRTCTYLLETHTYVSICNSSEEREAAFEELE